MRNELYRRIFEPASHSKDGESPGFICVTQETNGYAVWRCDYDGEAMLKWSQYSREDAIEYAVEVSASLQQKARAA